MTRLSLGMLPSTLHLRLRHVVHDAAASPYKLSPVTLVTITATPRSDLPAISDKVATLDVAQLAMHRQRSDTVLGSAYSYVRNLQLATGQPYSNIR